MNAKRILALLLLSAAGCGAANGSSILVKGRVPAPTATAGTTCSFSAGSSYTSGGTFDLLGAMTYILPLEVDNNMEDPGTAGTGSSHGLTWVADKVQTRVISAGYSPALLAVAGETIMPTDTTAVGEGEKAVLFVPVIYPDLATKIASAAGAFTGEQTIVVGYKLRGHLVGDQTSLDTPEHTYAINICLGCLVGVPSCPTGKTVTAVASCFPAGEDISLYTCQ